MGERGGVEHLEQLLGFHDLPPLGARETLDAHPVGAVIRDAVIVLERRQELRERLRHVAPAPQKEVRSGGDVLDRNLDGASAEALQSPGLPRLKVEAVEVPFLPLERRTCERLDLLLELGPANGPERRTVGTNDHRRPELSGDRPDGLHDRRADERLVRLEQAQGLAREPAVHQSSARASHSSSAVRYSSGVSTLATTPGSSTATRRTCTPNSGNRERRGASLRRSRMSARTAERHRTGWPPRPP